MQEQTTQQQTAQAAATSAAIEQVRVHLGGVTELTLGGEAGSSEDKRYVYS